MTEDLILVYECINKLNDIDLFRQFEIQSYLSNRNSGNDAAHISAKASTQAEY